MHLYFYSCAIFEYTRFLHLQYPKQTGIEISVSLQFNTINRMKKKKFFFDHRIPLHLIHCECTTETDLTGWQSGSDLSG